LVSALERLLAAAAAAREAGAETAEEAAAMGSEGDGEAAAV
jgi:hypothetical protein